VTARLSSLSTRAQVALVAGGLLFVALIVYFAVISPKRSTAAQLKQQTAAVQAQIDQNRSTAFTPLMAKPLIAPSQSEQPRHYRWMGREAVGLVQLIDSPVLQ